MLYFSFHMRTSRHSLIKQLQTRFPRGTPFDLAALAKIGVSAKLAAQYAKTGWLVRLAQGLYAFPADTLDAHAAIKYLQTRVAGLHAGGKTALALQGVRHNLATREQLVLWGDARFSLPAWFTSRFPARYVWAKLFNWQDPSFAEKTMTTPPGVTEGLRVSVIERAVLEMLYDVGTRLGLEEAHNLFEALSSPRTDVLGRLLACCTSVKTVRLFLTWARETQVVDVHALRQQYVLQVGSNTRWMTRLKDGTLLTLTPNG